MIGLGISIRAQVAQAQAKLNNLGLSIKPEILLRAVGRRHLKWVNDNLKGAGIEKAHAPMAKNTIVARPQRTSSRHFSSRFRSRLSQSFTVAVTPSRVTVGTEDQLAAHHHFGTRPHVITPGSKSVLSFVTADGRIARPIVNHPGIPARPLLPSDKLGEQLAVQVVEAIVTQAARKAST